MSNYVVGDVLSLKSDWKVIAIRSGACDLRATFTSGYRVVNVDMTMPFAQMDEMGFEFVQRGFPAVGTQWKFTEPFGDYTKGIVYVHLGNGTYAEKAGTNPYRNIRESNIETLSTEYLTQVYDD